jgi:hypothetical protein
MAMLALNIFELTAAMMRRPATMGAQHRPERGYRGREEGQASIDDEEPEGSVELEEAGSRGSFW